MSQTVQQPEVTPQISRGKIGLGRGTVLWILFFLISFGLGYATLNRYDPRTTGLKDTVAYYEIVAHGPTADLEHMRFRVLVPFLAKPFYWAARGRVGTWDPVFFGLLVANSLLVATTALLLVRIGSQQAGDLAVAMLGATIYLLNFEVPNLRLAGLIDAGEGCFLMFVVWSLLEDRWRLLPLWGLLGALSKETFVPYAAVLVTVWWLVSSRHHAARLSRAAWGAGMVAIAFAAVGILQAGLVGHVVWPWQFAATLGTWPGFGRRFARLLGDRQSWYGFVWLLPLGLWQLKRLSRPWCIASATTVLCPLVLSAYHNADPGTWGRAAFSIAGPLLSLSVALVLSGPARSIDREAARVQ
jgi:hypothetical protein